MKNLVRIADNAKTAFVYPITKDESIEIFGYVHESGDTYALVMVNERRGFAKKRLVRYNADGEPYCSLSIHGKRERVYLHDCRRLVH